MLSNFQFEGFIIKNIDYKAESVENNDVAPVDDEFNFAYTLKNDDNTYILSLLTHVINVQVDHYLDITVETRGRFIFQDDEDMDFNERCNLIKENGSAIMFPYVRSLIYNLTCADSFNDPVIMPTINFSKIISDIDRKDQEQK